MDFIILFYSDIKSLIDGIKSDDLVYPMCFLAWIFMLFLSLAKFDRRDFVTFLTYTLCLFCFATILFIILPNLSMGDHLDVVRQTLLMIITIFIIAARWLIAPSGLTSIATHIQSKRKSQ